MWDLYNEVLVFGPKGKICGKRDLFLLSDIHADHSLMKTRNKDPFTFTVGDKTFIPGLHQAVVGMYVGQQKKVPLPANLAFGPKHQDLIVEVPRSQIPDHINCQQDQKIEITLDNKAPLQATIVTVSDATITLDSNPPEAGQAFTLALELLDIN